MNTNNPTWWIWALCCAWVLLPILLTVIAHGIMVRIAKRTPKLEQSTWKKDGRFHRVWAWDIQERQGSTAREVRDE